jgi:hypothetical protein
MHSVTKWFLFRLSKILTVIRPSLSVACDTFDEPDTAGQAQLGRDCISPNVVHPSKN